ncbi:MAG: hypothetical protein WD696_21885 [Bryobacteraceae bacterium]
MRLALTVGYRVLVCDNMAFHGDFTPVLAKHSKSFSLVDALSIGVDRMQRNFDPMQKQIETGRESQISDVTAKLVIYRAFVESELEVPKHLARPVHDHYFNPQLEEFQPRTIWSLSNAFTSALKKMDAVPQFRATARLFIASTSMNREGNARVVRASTSTGLTVVDVIPPRNSSTFRTNSCRRSRLVTSLPATHMTAANHDSEL